MEKLLEQCIQEEQRYQFPSLSRDDVWELGLCMVEACRATGKPLATEIVINGVKVFCYYPAGTGHDNERWLGFKRNTVQATEKSSLRVFAETQLSGAQMVEDLKFDPLQYAVCGGGFPLKLKDGCMIGFIGTSGLPHLEDHAALIDGLRRYFEKKGW